MLGRHQGRRGPRLIFGFAASLLLILLACSDASDAQKKEGELVQPVAPKEQSQGHAITGFAVASSAFKDGGAIPKQFTCDGEDVSPALSWSEVPAATKSFALIADDPDAPAGTWVHWVIYDLPANLRELAENVSKESELKAGGRQGVNDFRKTGYNGPCPPPGKPHRYFFKLYALDQPLNLKSGINKAELEKAMQSHVLAEAQILGRFDR
jgi:Raf kinase inhibitor-like YbhB/YbcL family protein